MWLFFAVRNWENLFSLKVSPELNTTESLIYNPREDVTLFLTQQN